MMLVGISVTYLESIFSGETLVAMCAWEWLDREMYPLMSLQIVVPVEALGALITLERSICCGLLLMSGVVAMTEEMGDIRSMSTVEWLHHLWDSTDQSHLTIWIANVRIDW